MKPHGEGDSWRQPSAPAGRDLIHKLVYGTGLTLLFSVSAVYQLTRAPAD